MTKPNAIPTATCSSVAASGWKPMLTRWNRPNRTAANSVPNGKRQPRQRITAWIDLFNDVWITPRKSSSSDGPTTNARATSCAARVTGLTCRRAGGEANATMALPAVMISDRTYQGRSCRKSSPPTGKRRPKTKTQVSAIAAIQACAAYVATTPGIQRARSAMTTARPPAIARAKATTASTQDPRPLSDRGHHPVLRFLNVPGGIRLHRGPIRGSIVGRVRFFPGLGTSIAQDPDELVFLIDRPGADDLEAMAPPEWGDQPRPLVKPGPHFARLDGVDAALVGQRLLAAFEDDDRNLAARQLLLTHDIGDERREPLPFIGPSRSRPYLDLVRSDFNRSDRV